MAGKAHRKATGLHWDLARVIAKLFLIVAPAAARLGEAPVPAPPALLPLESEELLRGGRARTVEFWQNWSRSLKSLDVSYSSDPSLAELQVGWGKRVWISGPQASYRQLVLVLESSILEILRSTFAGFRMLNVLLLVASGSPPPELSLLVLVKDMGYEHLATTTRYGNTCCASCGNVDTARLVNGTGFYAVAAAQSMQTGGRGDGHYCTSSATSRNGTVGMGCLSCAKGRFLKAHPFLYPLWAQPEDPIFNEEYRLVVADTCPHRGNEAWCPGADGRANHFGVKDHFDFAAPPPKFDNYYFVWSKMECPENLKTRYAQQSRC
ncbi:unnamed protein product [Durusdinium trenchii]|uniref:Uncharacterized protein n=1 Tax=Durusdinium trenchii TaxID=1381693 RepID=A0ABP0NDJ0_9DINO